MADFKLLQSQQLKLEQILAPQQIQSLEILLAPLLELQEKISQELSDNPVLEQQKTPGEEIVADLTPENKNISENDDSADIIKNDDELAALVQLSDSWYDSLPPFHSRINFSSDDEEKREHFFNSLAEEPSLQEQLLEQLRLTETDSKTSKIAELIIGSIDENGYLRSHLADLATACNADIKEMEKALTLVQSFHPAGIGARDFQECLLLQLKRQSQKKPKTIELVKKHLEDLARNRLPQIAKKMKITLPELYELIDDIRTLNPHPGASVAPNKPIYVIPEVVVEEQNGEFVVVSNDDTLPHLRISPFYRKLLENPETSEETISYIKNKLSSGKMLIKSIEQRQSTIRKIAEVIVDAQYDFLKNGVKHLRPMTMQQVADKLGLHETTISRAIANKYIKTPVGLFEFKYFFTTGFQADDGEELSSKSVKEQINDLISSEDSAKPLSDKKIVDLLQEKGIPIARRTVAKYREEMNIPASHLRKEF